MILTKENFAQRYPGLAPTTYAALRLWLDQLDARSYGSTQYWRDLSRLGNHFEQATADNQPSIAGPSRVFDGTNDYLQQETLYSNASVACTIVLTAGSASLLVTGVSLTPYAGKFVRVYDGAKYAWGYITTGAGPIVSTVGGATQNWTGQEAGFNVGAATFKVEIFEPRLNILGSMTILAWIKPNDGQPAATQILLSRWTTATNRALILRLETTGKLSFVVSPDGVNYGTESTNTAVFANGTVSWKHIAAVYDGAGEAFIYTNGALVASTEFGSFGTTIFDTFAELRIGVNAGTTSPFAGSIAQVMIFAGALSAAEIRRIYLRDLPRYQVA